MNNPAEGFLKKGYLLVRAEIRLKLQDNERWTASVKRKTAACTVCSTSRSKQRRYLMSAVEAEGTAKSLSISIVFGDL